MKDWKRETSFFSGRIFFKIRVSLVAMPLVFGMLLILFLAGAAAGTGLITGVSTDTIGGQGNDFSWYPAMSADGRYVAFWSYASNLVPGDANSFSDVFVKDTVTGAITLISTDASGGQGNNDSGFPSMSADGRYIAFYSFTTNLVPGDTNGRDDVFLKDTVSGAIALVSTDSTGGQGNSSSFDPLISADGRYVAFSSWASNLVPGDSNGSADVFLKDTVTGSTTRASTGSAGVQSNNGSGYPSISADGRYVAFQSGATNLVAGDTNAKEDIFVKDTLAGATTCISTDSAGLQSNGHNFSPAISADGRYVAFYSRATNLVTGDTNAREDVFVKDTVTGAITRVSTDSAGVQGNSYSWYPSISGDGRYVTFHSEASNLVPGDTNGFSDVFVKDTVTGAIALVSTDVSGGQGNDKSEYPVISTDGSYVAFHSYASNLIPGDTNGSPDVFIVATSACTGGTQPTLTLSRNTAYWASLADYAGGLLSVDFVIANNGTEPVYQASIVGTVDTNGVTMADAVGGGDIPNGGSTAITIKYNVLASVASFKTTVFATALDSCGNSYSYPGPYPGP